MEKYSRFRDEGTGVAPFQTARYNSQEFNIAQKTLLYTFSFVSSLFAWLSLLSYLALMRWLLPGFLARWYLKFIVFMPLRMFYTNFYYEGERRASVRKKTIQKAQPGDVILSNFVSPLDALVYESYLPSVQFVFPTKDGKFECVSTFQTISRSLSARTPSPSGSTLESITSSAKRVGAIVVVFVEGTTTNGRGLLTIKDLGAQDIAKVDSYIFAAAIRYTPASASAPVPISLFSYIRGISNATWWYMASVKLSGEPLAKATLTRDQISRSIAGLGRLRILGDKLDANAKQEYLRLKTKK